MSDQELLKVLPNNIEFVRRKMKLLRHDFAAALDVTVQTVTFWETGRNTPSAIMLAKIKQLTGCSLDALFTVEMKKNNDDNQNLLNENN